MSGTATQPARLEPPFATPLLGPGGLVSVPWQAFFSLLTDRVGAGNVGVVRAGALTSGPTGLVDVRFDPPFLTACAMAAVFDPAGVAHISGLLVTATGFSGLLVDATPAALPSYPVTFYAIGY